MSIIAQSGIENLLSKIEATEEQVKKAFPGKRGRVVIANAKQTIDYEFGRDINQMEWAARYLQELSKNL